MTTLENTHLRVTVRPQGAELTSIFHKTTGIEFLWQADPAVWGWHAPNLFPIVGGLLNDQLWIDGQPYDMKRHGFTRQSVFTLVESSDSRAVFSLRSNESTKAVYPYAFDFQIIYELTDASVRVTYRVTNEGDKTMFFSVGAHPAFNVPFQSNGHETDEAYTNYYVTFDQPESLVTHRLSEAGLFTGETQPVPTDGNRLYLTEHLFDHDALVFKELTSRQVSLRSDRNAHAVTLTFAEFPYLGIWAKPGASFVCLEPWLGCADSEGEPTPIEQREAIQQVDAGKVFTASFTISVQ